MNKTPQATRAQIVRMLLAGNSTREIRLATGVSVNTVVRLRRQLGLPVRRRLGKGHQADPVDDPLAAMIDGALRLLDQHERLTRSV